MQELPQHYREVLLLRFFEDQTPTAIASRLDVPISTVKTRLARAQAQVRERLDRTHGGDGKTWLVALAPLLIDRPKAKATLQAAGVPFTAGLAIIISLAGVLLLVLVPRRTESASGVGPEQVANVGLDETAARHAFGSAASAAANARVPLPRSESASSAKIDNRFQPGIQLRGRVLDELGRAVPNVVCASDPMTRAPREERGSR